MFAMALSISVHTSTPVTALPTSIPETPSTYTHLPHPPHPHTPLLSAIGVHLSVLSHLFGNENSLRSSLMLLLFISGQRRLEVE